MKYTAWTEHETIATGNTMEECLKGIYEVASIEDVIEWNIWITAENAEEEYSEDFCSTDVYDMLNAMLAE